SFLAASRNRANRRTVAAALVILLAGLGVTVAGGLSFAKNRGDRTNDQRATMYSLEQDQLTAVHPDVYGGLSIAAGLGGDKPEVHALVIEAALRDRVPDAAFDVPTSATTLVVKPIGTDVVVADAGGQQWRRAATATQVRTSTPVVPPSYHPG